MAALVCAAMAVAGCDSSSASTASAAGNDTGTSAEKSAVAETSEDTGASAASVETESVSSASAGVDSAKVDVILKTLSAEYWQYVKAGCDAYAADHPGIILLH